MASKDTWIFQKLFSGAKSGDGVIAHKLACLQQCMPAAAYCSFLALVPENAMCCHHGVIVPSTFQIPLPVHCFGFSVYSLKPTLCRAWYGPPCMGEEKQDHCRGWYGALQ